MAQFEGTIVEFMRFIGPHARIMVWNITQKHRKKVGKCEECASSIKLEAAHIKGKERPVLIANILSQFKEDEVIRIDLNEFEERFIEAHLPIESTIRILCNVCHKKYDNLNQGHKIVTEVTEIDNPAEFDKYSIEEAKIVQNLINEKEMDKTKAINISKTKSLTTLHLSNTLFSNINAGQNVWWLEPNNKKFTSDLYFILNNDRSKMLYIFKLPANTIRKPADHFNQRNDNYRTNCSDIYIPVSGIKFSDKRGFNFNKYLIEKIEY